MDSPSTPTLTHLVGGWLASLADTKHTFQKNIEQKNKEKNGGQEGCGIKQRRFVDRVKNKGKQSKEFQGSSKEEDSRVEWVGEGGN